MEREEKYLEDGCLRRKRESVKRMKKTKEVNKSCSPLFDVYNCIYISSQTTSTLAHPPSSPYSIDIYPPFYIYIPSHLSISQHLMHIPYPPISSLYLESPTLFSSHAAASLKFTLKRGCRKSGNIRIMAPLVNLVTMRGWQMGTKQQENNTSNAN